MFTLSHPVHDECEGMQVGLAKRNPTLAAKETHVARVVGLPFASPAYRPDRPAGSTARERPVRLHPPGMASAKERVEVAGPTPLPADTLALGAHRLHEFGSGVAVDHPRRNREIGRIHRNQ